MPTNPRVTNKLKVSGSVQIKNVAQKTDRMEMFWLRGKRRELPVFRVPISHLYFNIENGRYADKMVQLRQENPGVEINPKEEQWKSKIWAMLKGEYSGAEKDREPFERLKRDLLAREQLRPGVVLNDGGVLDGNRRFAVLTDLYLTEKNPARFEYFDAVILPEDVTAEDRWRIEAGLQIGRDEKLDYSPINRLLKIKEGQKLFGHTKDAAGEIANTLMGVSKEEVERDITKIQLIDQYLAFRKKPDCYMLVSDLMERFEEAVSILETAKKAKLLPEDLALLRLKLFALIQFEIMDNWQLREIRAALGVAGRGQNGRRKNERALKNLLAVKNKESLRKALIEDDRKGTVVQEEAARASTFIDSMDAAKEMDNPLKLAQRAQTNLAQLQETLKDGTVAKLKGWKTQGNNLSDLLKEVSALTNTCTSLLKKLKK